MHWRRNWQPPPVFLPGESQGQRSPADCSLWGHTESDMTEATQQQQHQQESETTDRHFTKSSQTAQRELLLGNETLWKEVINLCPLTQRKWRSKHVNSGLTVTKVQLLSLFHAILTINVYQYTENGQKIMVKNVRILSCWMISQFETSEMYSEAVICYTS